MNNMENRTSQNDANTDEITRLHDKIKQLENTNAQNEVYKQKYVDVIGKLMKLPNPTASADEDQLSLLTLSNPDELLENSDKMINEVVSLVSIYMYLFVSNSFLRLYNIEIGILTNMILAAV